MSVETPNSTVEPTRDMIWCGSHILETSDRSSDGLHGRISVGSDKIQQADVEGGEKVTLIAEANGKRIRTQRPVHKDGASITIPTADRKSLELKEGDEVKCWIDSVDEMNGTDRQNIQKTLTKKENRSTRLSLKFTGEDVYHFIDDEGSQETVCGIALNEREDYQTDKEEPKSLLDPCKSCQDKVRSSETMTNKELAEWIGNEVGFTIEDTSVPSYFDKEQLVMIREYILSLEQDQRDA